VPGAHCSVLLSFPLFNHTKGEEGNQIVSYGVCKFGVLIPIAHRQTEM
jgi:hypothetical protein